MTTKSSATKKAGTAGKPTAARASKAAVPPPDQAKHRRAAEMLRELRSRAEALSANADRLLSRLA